MAFSPGDFIPNEAQWPFREFNSGDQIPIALKSRTEPAGRRIELTGPPDHVFRAFFDRMTVTAVGLELNRLRLQTNPASPLQILDIRPPLVITTDDKPNRVANLFPGLTGAFPNSNPPYDGSVTLKKIENVTLPGSQERDAIWKIRLDSRSPEKSEVFRPRFLFSQKQGLIFYTGDVYGLFFEYVRTDVGERYRALAPEIINPRTN